jgi:hypothetical protein
MDTHIYNFMVRVLIFQEDGQFCAHALEMDLLGYGKTEKEAVAELAELIRSQISFARFKNDDGLLRFPASKEDYTRWEAAHIAALKREIFPDKSTAIAIKATWADISQELTHAPSRFKPMEMACA